MNMETKISNIVNDLANTSEPYTLTFANGGLTALGTIPMNISGSRTFNGGVNVQVVSEPTNWAVNYCSSSWWPTYWPSVYEDRHAKAFRIVKVLMDKKLVGLKTIKQFVDLVDELAQVV